MRTRWHSRLVRLGEELCTAQAEVRRTEDKLATSLFVARAPAAVVEKERERLRTAIERVTKLESRRRELGQSSSRLSFTRC